MLNQTRNRLACVLPLIAKDEAEGGRRSAHGLRSCGWGWSKMAAGGVSELWGSSSSARPSWLGSPSSPPTPAAAAPAAQPSPPVHAQELSDLPLVRSSEITGGGRLPAGREGGDLAALTDAGGWRAGGGRSCAGGGGAGGLAALT